MDYGSSMKEFDRIYGINRIYRILELLQLFHRDRRRVRQATWQASLFESDGLGVDGNMEGAGNTIAHSLAWT